MKLNAAFDKIKSLPFVKKFKVHYHTDYSVVWVVFEVKHMVYRQKSSYFPNTEDAELVSHGYWDMVKHMRTVRNV